MRPRPSRAPLLLGLLALAVALAVVVSGQLLRDDPASEAASEPASQTPSRAASKAAPVPSESTTAAPCVPGPGRPVPTVDLGVQPSTDTSLLSRDEVDRLVALAQDAGATVISTSASWRYLQPTAETAPADFVYRGVDRVIRSAQAAGLEVRLQLIGMPEWAVSPGSAPWSPTRPPLDDAERQRWTAFVTEVARHVAGGVTYLEVWNEPNGTAYWPTGPDPAAYAALLAATYDPVTAVAPDLQVVTGGLAGNDIGYLGALYDALGPTHPFDLVGVHPFTGTAAPDVVDPARTYSRDPFGLVDDDFTGYTKLHELMSERGDADTDLYLGAFGYDTASVPDEVRAGYVTEALEQVTCTPYVRALSWYYLHPTPWDPVGWTLLGADLAPTRTYDAFVAWKERAAGSS